tara:strand:+ start:741 stop:1547 length:807 start_codon:yes stop_codon:yes gene_type:complete
MSSSAAPQRIHFVKSDWKILHGALNADITSMVENEYTDWNSYDADVIDWYTSVDDWDSQCKDKSKPIKHYNTDNPDVIEYYDEKQLIKKMDEFYELHHLQIKMGHKCPDLRTHYSVMNDVILKWEKEFGLKSRIKQKKEKKKKAKIAIIAPPEGEGDDRIGCYFQQHYTPDFEEPERRAIKKTCLYKVNKITEKRVFVDICFRKSIVLSGEDVFPFRFDVEKNKCIPKTEWDTWNVVKVDYNFDVWETNQREAVAMLISQHNPTIIYG